MSVTLEFDFRPDGTLEGVWQLASDHTADEKDRLYSQLASMTANERSVFFFAVVSALTRTVEVGHLYDPN